MKKIIVLILVIATLLNIIAGSFIFLDIQAFEVPETTLTMELVKLTSDEALLQTTLWINNSNSFSIFLQDLTIITITDTGDTVASFFIKGGEILGQENKTFTITQPIRFNETAPNHLISKITGTAGILFLGIVKKTVPLKFSLITSLNNIINQFKLPSIQLTGNFSDITQEGVNFTGYLQITNPYPFYLAVENLTLTVETDTGIQVGTVTIEGKTIEANTSQQLAGSGNLLLKALDATTLHMALEGNVVLSIAGIRKTMNLSLNADIIPPHLEQLLSDLPTDASLTGKYKLTLSGLLDQISFTVVNPNKLTFLATDITVSIYRIDRDQQRLICNGTLEDGVITSQNTTILRGDMLIPYSQLWPRIGERLFADRLQVILRANITIQGLNQTIWVGMIGYQDFPFHRL
jgi:LEA14-like dessication related protein